MLHRCFCLSVFLLISFGTASKVPIQQNQTEVLKEDLESKNHELNTTTANTQNSYGETQMILYKELLSKIAYLTSLSHLDVKDQDPISEPDNGLSTWEKVLVGVGATIIVIGIVLIWWCCPEMRFCLCDCILNNLLK